MAKEQSLFKTATFWLNKICVLPYSDEELEAIGCLGFDMAKHKDFADRYMLELQNKCKITEPHKRLPFSELNLQLYRKVLAQPDLQQIPDWIRMPDPKQLAKNDIKARIVKMSQNILKNGTTSSENMPQDNTR